MTRRLRFALVATLLLALAVVSALTLAGTTRGNSDGGVVGNGTPASCTDDALVAAIAGGGTVTFNCGAAVHTINVSPALVIDNVNVVIDGDNKIVLNGMGTNRIFSSSTTGSLALRDIVLTHGYSTGDGGAMAMSVPTTLEHVTIQHSISDASGGAILMARAPLTATNSIFQENRATNGGAIYPRYSTSIVTLINSTLRNNRAVTDSPGAHGWGGAMLLWDGAVVTIQGGTLEGNSGEIGGAIHLRHDRSNVTISGASLTNNEAHQSAGAIYVEHGILSVEACTFEDNHALQGNGGAILVVTGILAMTDCLVTGNSSTNAAGGGALALSYSIATIDRSDFISNVAGASGPSSVLGGAIFSFGSNPSYPWLDITQSSFVQNEASSGGAIYIGGESRLDLRGSTLEGNRARGTLDEAGTGGGLAIGGNASASIENVTIANNVVDMVGSDGGLGGGIYGPAGVGMVNVTIAGNQASAGGGVFFTSALTRPVFNTVLAGNSAGNCNPLRVNAATYSLSTDDTCFATGLTNQVDQPAGLGALLNNGGIGRTMLPQAGSSLIDRGSCVEAPIADQRGISRPQLLTCDIGSLEVPPTPVSTATPTRTPTATASPTATRTQSAPATQTPPETPTPAAIIYLPVVED